MSINNIVYALFHSDHSRYYYRFLLNVESLIKYTFKTKMVSKILITSPFFISYFYYKARQRILNPLYLPQKDCVAFQNQWYSLDHALK